MALDKYSELDLSRNHRAEEAGIEELQEADVEDILARIGKRAKKDQLNCGACGYETCVEHAIAIKRGIAEVEMCLPYTIETA